MKSIKQNFNDLRIVIGKTNIVWRFVFVAEVLVVIILGILANQYEGINFSSPSFILLIVFCAIYLLIKLFFLFINEILSKSPVDELEAKYELGLYKKGFSRINIINETISRCLHMLNDRTCFLTSDDHQDERSSNICEQNLKDGLTVVLAPFMKNFSVIFDSHNIKFTLGIFIECFNHLTPTNQLESHEHIVILNDDLHLEQYIPSNLYSQSNTKDIALEIQSGIKKSYNNNKYLELQIYKGDKTLQMISSIIPCVCTGENQDGVLFIIFEPIDNVLHDLRTTLDIFNRIIANWLSCYNECLMKKAFPEM